MVMLAAWTLSLWVVMLVATWRFVRRRRGWLAIASLVLAAFAGAAIEFFAPPFGGFDPIAARYWISQAAAEHDAARKEALVRRVALQSPEYGWFTASEAIGSVEEPIQRCRLRTILASLPVRNRERLGKEASAECNSTISKGRS